MAVVVQTKNPSSLLLAIHKAIDKDTVQAWSYDADGDFTYTVDQLTRRAWFRPVVYEDRLVFNIIPPRARTISKGVYGIYHGRFIEMLLNYFDKSFTEVSATALPTGADRTRGQIAGV